MINNIFKNESVIESIKKYAKNHTALFTAICSGLITFLTFILKLCYFSYQYGKLTAFHINMNAINLIKETSIFNILFYVVLAGIMIILNYLGYIFYRQNSLIKYFLTLFPIVLIIFTVLFSNVTEISLPDIIKDSSYVFLIILFSVIMIPIINMIVIANTLSPSINDLYCRLEAKYNEFHKKNDIDKINKPKHIKKYAIKMNKLLFKTEIIEAKKNNSKNKKAIRKEFFQLLKLKFISYKKYDIKTVKKDSEYIKKYIEEYTSKIENKSNYKKADANSDLLLKITITTIMLVVIVGLLFVFGYSHSNGITKIDIIENSNYFAENSNKIDCAIIYENEEYVIISPCYEMNNELKINTSYQYRTENSNITKHTMIYDNVVITQYGDLTKYYKT